MSYYTEIILTCSAMDSVSSVNCLREILCVYDIDLYNTELHCVFVARENYLYLDRFIDAINYVEWTSPSSVQMSSREENDETFSECDLSPAQLSDVAMFKSGDGTYFLDRTHPRMVSPVKILEVCDIESEPLYVHYLTLRRMPLSDRYFTFIEKLSQNECDDIEKLEKKINEIQRI